jgi:UDP-N-acetylglucosamine--N-acetylmuramyl-(pentapeptide) pyrophosphoryl-undecaprenol N-acetylglucosamine transferase
LAAGGTGGHIFPACALKDEMISRGYKVSFITDERGLAYQDYFKGVDIYKIKSVTFSQKNIFKKCLTVLDLYKSVREAKKLLRGMNSAVSAVVGFGGYPSFPVVWAARQCDVPCCIHEQNAVLGRVNRLLAKKADALALSFRETKKADIARYKSVYITGNPVRETISTIGTQAYPTLDDQGIFKILIIGGSQGARIFSDVIPLAISLLDDALKSRLHLVQQCRQEDRERVQSYYEQRGIKADITPFIKHMDQQLSSAHLLIGRAGASTISEITAAGRPAILVPYPHATDQHQRENVKELIIAGGGWVIQEDAFTPSELAALLQRLLKRPQDVIKAAQYALSTGKKSAAKDLSDVVEKLINPTFMRKNKE